MKYCLTYDYFKLDDTLLFNGEEVYLEYEEDLDAFNDSGLFDYYVEEELKDIIKYLFLKKYHKAYRELGWWLEDGAKEFVKDIENKYYHNEFDSYELYHNYKFLDFLKELHSDDAMREFVSEVI